MLVGLIFALQKFFCLKLFSTFLFFSPTERRFWHFRDDRQTVCHVWRLDMRHIPLPPFLSDLADPELDQLLHPASAFDHPRDVVRDPDLTLEEKRAILSSWASDACAVESQPALRRPPGAKQPVGFDEIVDALGNLGKDPPPKWKRIVGRRRSGNDESPDGGMPFSA
jgi:hypothetical protein